MSRRIWVAEGFASDGDIYGRALQLPNGEARNGSGVQGEVQRTPASVLKSHQVDIISCPCMDAMLPRDQGEVQTDLRGG